MSTSLSRRTATVTLYQGDDFERLAELRRAADLATARAEEAEKNGAARADGEPADPELAADAQRKQGEYDAFVDVASERAIGVRLRAMPGKKFRALMAEHPPREDHDGDAQYDVNTETLPDPLLVESIEEPVLSPGARQDFVDDLAEGDYERLWVSAYWLNRMPGGDPKAGKFSAGSPNSGETSN